MTDEMEVVGTTIVPQETEGLQGPVLEHIEVFYLTHADVMYDSKIVC